MLEIIPKIPFYQLFRKIGFPKILPMNYTVSLLYQCNSRCSTCNVYKKKSDNLTVEEYVKIFKNIGKAPYWITFSGGEPFLRKDLVEVVTKIYRISKPRIINIPSNGILTERILDFVPKIAFKCQDANLIINLSIDGIGSQHDSIRNVKGNYVKVMETYRRLKELRIPNLSIGIHTVISRFNVRDFTSIATQLMDLNPDSYITEIAEERNELGTINANITPSMLSYKSSIDFLIHRIKHTKYKGMNKITQAFRIEYYNLVKKILRDKTQVIPCYAGISSVQISPDGDIWQCCVKADSFGNLRENNYNFKKIWKSKKMQEERKKIAEKSCHCPLANASYTNMLMDYPTLFRVFYRSFIKWWV